MRKKGGGGFVSIGDLIADVMPLTPEIPEEEQAATKVKPSSKRSIQRSNRLVAVAEDRQDGQPQHLGYLARPFILCGLPFKKPKKGVHYYKRQNGNELLEIISSPEHGLPFGMDIEVLIWTCILAKEAMSTNDNKCPEVLEFKSGADFLKAFDLPLDGASYQRAIERFTRIFYSTWYFGPAARPRKLKAEAFRFYRKVNLWFDPDLHTPTFPGEEIFKDNQLFLSEELRREMERSLPVIELDTIRAWANNPTQVYFNIWLAWRCHEAKPETEIPLMGPNGLKEQCGFDGYHGQTGARNFRKKIIKLLAGAKVSWPDCPARLETNEPPGVDLLVIDRPGTPIRKRSAKQLA